MITVQRAAKAAGKHVSKGLLSVRAALGAERRQDCPACGAHVVGFFRYGDCADWGCPSCGASPRERLMCALLDSGRLIVPAGGSVLHMAPNEASLVLRYRVKAGDYVPADIDPSRYAVPGMQAMDLMQLGSVAQDAARYDIIYASHVMEHVPDDAVVLANMLRALKPGGQAWLIVPLWNHATEDGSYAMPPRERERRFGQWDHVRQYGLDFGDRIRNAGFNLAILSPDDLDAGIVRRQALGECVFIASKPG